jgi:hypothetical protein
MLTIQSTAMQRVTALAILLLLAPLLAVARPQPAGAAGVVSECTEAALRAALEGGGLVTFISGCDWIVLTSQLEINADTTIDGGGAVTLDGGVVTRLIAVNSGADLTLSGLTLTRGRASGDDEAGDGGAILNNGALTISDSVLTGNTAQRDGGAILNNGALTISDSVLTGNSAQRDGGAIQNTGTLTIVTSTLTRNAAEDRVGAGGAILNDEGTATITDSILSANSGGNGGAIYNASLSRLTLVASTLSGNRGAFHGGAIRNSSSLTIIASTLSGNSAVIGGAIFNSLDAILTLVASTLSANSASIGGAIDNEGFVTLTASTLAGNSADNGGGGTLYSGFDAKKMIISASILSGAALCAGVPELRITSTGYNVASDATCNLAGSDDLQNVDPLLGPLQDNDGPTDTMLPAAASPAIDRVPNAVCAKLSAANDGRDQRGAVRPEGDANCDSGAVEVGAPIPVQLLAAYATPNPILEGQSATITALATGPVGVQLEYTFACPTGAVGPQAGASAVCSFPKAGDIAVTVSVSAIGMAGADSTTVTVTVAMVQVTVTLTPDRVTFIEGGTYEGSGSFTSDA